jgi:hypothetical protein
MKRDAAIRFSDTEDTEDTEKEEKYKTKTRVFSVFSSLLRDLRVPRLDSKYLLKASPFCVFSWLIPRRNHFECAVLFGVKGMLQSGFSNNGEHEERRGI